MYPNHLNLLIHIAEECSLLRFAVQDYMGMLGNYSQPNLMDFTRHSIHSLNFYQAQFRQYQLELFPPYMRSNTISIMSNASSDYSTTSGGSGEEHQAAAPALPPKQVKVRKNKYSETFTFSE